MILQPQNAQDKITRAMVKMQKEFPFFSYILMHFKASATERKGIRTAGVNKRGDIIYCGDWINTLGSDELIGVLVHETLHIAKGDFFRIGKRDKQIWNIASDAVINQIILKEGFKLPKGCAVPDSQGNFTVGGKTYNTNNKITEELYEELYANADKIKQSGGKGKGGEGEDEEPGDHGGIDVHMHDEEGEENPSEDSQLESKWKKVIVEAATNAQARGNLPGSMVSIVDKLLNPVIDWRTRVMKFITNEIPVDFTNRIPSRKFYGTGVWAPKTLRENLDVFISVDVSGSTMGDRTYFMSEIAAIVRSYEQIKARIIFWDGDVNEENDHLITANNRDKIVGLEIKDCNGGTQMSCYADYCEKKGYRSRLHIILTDGYIESNPRVPQGNIIFVLTKSGSDEHLKKLGAVCRLSDTEYNYK